MYVWIDRYRIIKKKKKLDAYCFIDTKREREKKNLALDLVKEK